MAGGDTIGIERARAIEQRRKLQVAVAMRARNGRAARDVFADEIRDDRALEFPLEVHDVVRDVQPVGHAARVVQIVDRAAGAEARLALGLVVELHRHTNHIVARTGQ